MQSAADIVFDKIDMSLIMAEKIAELDDLFSIRNINVIKDLEKDAFVNGNTELTSLAIGAFISNAVLYSSENSSIFVTVRREGDTMISEIRNSDAHIDEKDIDHLFEPFYRSDSSRSRNSGGSGLGLYIAKLIVMRQNGSCDLANEGNGVVATIRIPSA